jgi:hypothetical protein
MSSRAKWHMITPLPTRRCPICRTVFQPFREKHKYCCAECRGLAYTPSKLVPRLEAMCAVLLEKGLAPEDIRALISS